MTLPRSRVFVDKLQRIVSERLISSEMLLDVDPYYCKDDKEEPEQKNF